MPKGSLRVSMVLAAVSWLPGCQLIGDIRERDLVSDVDGGGGGADAAAADGDATELPAKDGAPVEEGGDERQIPDSSFDVMPVANEAGARDAAADVAAEVAPIEAGSNVHVGKIAFTEISAMANRTCGIKMADSTIACWGEQSTAAPSGTFQHVATGGLHTCGLTLAGAVVCAGSNTFGQTNAPAGTFTSIAAGNAHSCARDPSGVVTCWGDTSHGQILMPPSVYAEVYAGADRTCVLGYDFVVNCWGSGMTGQVNAPSMVTYVSVGDQQSCGVGKNNAGIVCWDNLGADVPMLERSGNYTKVTTGLSHVCALTTTGGLIECWGGSNAFGESKPPPTGTFKQVSAGYQHTCALAGDHTVACWGDDRKGQATPP